MSRGALLLTSMAILMVMLWGPAGQATSTTTLELEDSCEIEGTAFCFFNCEAGEFIKATSDNGPGVTVADCGGAAIAAWSTFGPRTLTSPTPARIAGSGMCTHIGTSSTGECSSGQ